MEDLLTMLSKNLPREDLVSYLETALAEPSGRRAVAELLADLLQQPADSGSATSLKIKVNKVGRTAEKKWSPRGKLKVTSPGLGTRKKASFAKKEKKLGEKELKGLVADVEKREKRRVKTDSEIASDREMAERALERFESGITEAQRKIQEQDAKGNNMMLEMRAMQKQLVEMGYTDEALNQRLLFKHSGNIERVVEELVSND